MYNNLVSIITPCHNSALHIRECIDSVLSQDYPYWEMLITDDGSTDNTAEIVEEYASRDSRIKLFHLENASGSPSAPRNNSIQNAQGEYIAFLDSDDIWMPNKLSEQVRFAQEYNYNIVYSYYEKMDNAGMRNNRIVMTDASYDYNKIIKTDGIPWLTLMIRRDLIDGLHFVKAEKEDYIFLLSLLHRGYTAYNTCKVHALYRETLTSRSSNKFKMFYGQWHIIRTHEGLPLYRALHCIIVYALNGIRKLLI